MEEILEPVGSEELGTEEEEAAALTVADPVEGEAAASAKAASQKPQRAATGASGDQPARPARGTEQIEEEETAQVGRVEPEPERVAVVPASEGPPEPLSVPLMRKLDLLGEDLQNAMEVETEHRRFVAKVTAASSFALSAGLVAWVLKGGVLLSSLIATLPAWSHFDPMPILGYKKRKQKQKKDEHDGPEGAGGEDHEEEHEEEHEEDRDYEALGRILDRSQRAGRRAPGGGHAS